MKRDELKKCVVCGEGVMHNNQLTFYRLRTQYMFVNVGAVQRQSGLEMMFGGHAGIAQAVGPDEDLADVVSETDVLVCLDCAMRTTLCGIMEMVNKESADDVEAEKETGQ